MLVITRLVSLSLFKLTKFGNCLNFSICACGCIFCSFNTFIVCVVFFYLNLLAVMREVVNIISKISGFKGAHFILLNRSKLATNLEINSI